MRVNWNIVKTLFMVLVLGLIYGFTNTRSEQRKISDFQIKFMDNNDLYLTEDAVNKLLIQNYGSVKNSSKEAIVLNTIEQVILTNPMVKNAEAYVSLQGELVTQISLKNQSLG